jgi:hypothetical protein
VLKRGAQKGYSKRGTTNRALKKSIQQSGESAAVACGCVCGILVGSARQCGAQRSYGLLCGMAVCIAYSRGTHTMGALTGGSGGRLPCITRAQARVCTGMARGLRQKGIHRVLPGYSHGTHMLLTWYSHGTHMVLTCYSHGTHMVLTWYSHGSHSAEYRVRRRAPLRQHCGCCLVTARH